MRSNTKSWESLIDSNDTLVNEYFCWISRFSKQIFVKDWYETYESSTLKSLEICGYRPLVRRYVYILVYRTVCMYTERHYVAGTLLSLREYTTTTPSYSVESVFQPSTFVRYLMDLSVGSLAAKSCHSRDHGLVVSAYLPFRSRYHARVSFPETTATLAKEWKTTGITAGNPHGNWSLNFP